MKTKVNIAWLASRIGDLCNRYNRNQPKALEETKPTKKGEDDDEEEDEREKKSKKRRASLGPPGSASKKLKSAAAAVSQSASKPKGKQATEQVVVVEEDPLLTTLPMSTAKYHEFIKKGFTVRRGRVREKRVNWLTW
jgi:hypothetical protein